MTHFTSIPLNDIKSFLLANKIEPSNEPYKDAWRLINANKNILVPESIADFFFASNLCKDNLPVYKLSKLISHNYDKDLPIILINLSKKRIIRILKYLNKLDNDLNIFDILPQDISHIIVNKLDIDSVRLICEISQKFTIFCRTHLQPLLKTNLKCSSNIDVENYNMKQLISLSQTIPKDNIKYYRSLILKDGMIYKDDVRIFELDNIIQLTVSNYHGIALTADGEVYVFGKNNYGQLGLNHQFDCQIPQLVSDIFDITSVSVSEQHSMLLSDNGNVYITINNKFVMLDNIKNVVQISAGNEHSLLLFNNGDVAIYRDSKVTDLLTNQAIEMVSTGNNHSLLLGKNGIVYGYGNNKYGQLGLGTKNDRIVDVATIDSLTDIVYIIAGTDYSLVLDKKGYAYEFGLKDDQINLLPTIIS